MNSSSYIKSSHWRCSVKRCSWKFRKIHRKTPVPESLFFSCNFIKMRLWLKCFPVNFVKFLRTPFLRSTSGRLLLLHEGFATSCYKIISSILLQELINDFAIFKYLLKIKLVTTILETRTTYFNKDPHFLIDQPRTCHIFMLCCIKSICLN